MATQARPPFGNLLDLTESQMQELVAAFGHKPFRTRQIWDYLYRRRIASISEMVELPSLLREHLMERWTVGALTPMLTVASASGEATKVQAQLADGKSIETVLMRYPTTETSGGRHTVCVSTQVGCAVGCPFCATGKMGFIRNLTPGEIVAQVLHFAQQYPVDNLVFMGMGEPFLNYDNMWQAVETLNSPHGFGLGARRFTISTSGVVPGIQRLTEEKILVNLAVSLHAPNDQLRTSLVPINRKYPVASLLQACDNYTEKTGRRVSYEYVLLDGVNDSEDLAHELGALLRGRLAHVNLIPVNPTPGSYRRPGSRAVHAFQTIVLNYGVRTTVRAEKGVEISAACGQLATAEPGAPVRGVTT